MVVGSTAQHNILVSWPGWGVGHEARDVRPLPPVLYCQNSAERRVAVHGL